MTKLLLKTIRWVLGSLILILNAVFAPKSVQRDPAEKSRIDQETQGLALYQFDACPFCVKVRRAMKRMDLNIEIRDVKKNKQWNTELVREGGQFQVPCLRIPEPGGKTRWLYESSDIIAYLEGRFLSKGA